LEEEFGMRKMLFKSLRMFLSTALFLAAVCTELYAIDNNNRYFAYGVGQRSCDDYVKFREKRLDILENHERYSKDELYEIVDKVVEHWIAGFLTAHNLYVSDTYDVLGTVTMDDVKIRLEKFCRANGKVYFAEAVITLVQELNPQRVKADKGK
jgi:hypothetical protein